MSFSGESAWNFDFSPGGVENREGMFFAGGVKGTVITVVFCNFARCVFSDFAKTSQNACVFALKGSRFGGFSISGDSDPPKVSKYDNKYVCFSLLRFSLKTHRNISFRKEINLCIKYLGRPGDFRFAENARSVTFFALKR